MELAKAQPYWSDKYGRFEVPNSISAIQALPFLERQELSKTELLNNLQKDYSAYYETSGTTGSPIPVLPDLSLARSNELGRFFDHWLGLRSGKIRTAVVALPYEMNPMGLKFHQALVSCGVRVIPAGVRTVLCPPARLIGLIHRLKANLLIGRPLEVMRYAEGMSILGLDSRACSIEKIVVTGEVLSINKIKRISELYGGAEVYSTYGMTEIDNGLVSCSQHSYHLSESRNLLIEVIARDGQAAALGRVGEVIASSLETLPIPLLRYRTGDLACVGVNCGCGNEMPFLQIVGRIVDEREIGGKNILPVAIEDVIFEFTALGCEYQLVIDEEGLEIRVERGFEADSAIDVATPLVHAVWEKLGIKCKVKVFPFNGLADKLGIAKQKGARFVDVVGIAKDAKESALRINACTGADLL